MTRAARWWIDNLPWRWALGGIFAGIGFVVLTTVVFDPVVGGPVDYVLYSLWVVVPFSVIGWAWGWQERRALRKAALRCPDGFAAPDEYHFLQMGKGAACGLALCVVVTVASAAWTLFADVQVASIQDAFIRDASIDDDVAEAASEIQMLYAFAFLAIAFGVIVGAAVGLVAGANLRRRLRAAGPAALT